jgi:SAM-dependent methyltransferase
MTHTPTHPVQHDTRGGHQHLGDDQGEILDLDAEVFAEHIAAITEWLPIQTPPRQIIDLGCGTGAGTFALLDRFPEAQVTAVDALTAEDRTALNQLLDTDSPHSILRRENLAMRTVWAARRR